jgi:hypothetical protein
MITDQQITDALAMIPGRWTIFEGEWQHAPYPAHVHNGRTFAVLVDDPQIARLVLDRDNGDVLALAEGEEPDLVNRSLDRFVASARAFEAARDDAESIDDDDEALEANGEHALAAIRAIDPDAVRGENQLWSTATEELGYGM